MAAFVLGGLFLVSVLALLTHVLARDYLLDQRQTSAVRQARANARLVATLVRVPGADLGRLLGTLEARETSRSVVLHGGSWYATSVAVGRDAIPSSLQRLVVDRGEAGRQRFRLGRQPALAVGIPLSDGDAYFEVFPLTELERSLRALRYALLLAGAATVAGCLALGAWASRRVLRPVAEIGQAAEAIAAGRFDSRLDVGGDAELAALAHGFNSMVESLEERLARDRRFASDVSHELRSPMTALKSAVQVMRTRRGTLDERGRHAFDVLATEVARFDRLVRDLLEISRAEAGTSEDTFEDIDLGDLAAIAVRGEVPVEVEGDGLWVRGDKRRLEQVVVNLVENARVHGGGAEFVRVLDEGPTVQLAVEDRGQGVPLEQRERIFERFARGPSAPGGSRPAGVGLGLAIVREHARAHGGRVWVEEREGGGARFVVELPRSEH
jgi:signal transduction histidine kinase